MTSATTAGKHTYAGLFMVTLATLMYEIHLTRIFSITMWYHFAFMAISITMFGMTVGALAVYLLPDYFSQERARMQMAQSAMLFGITIVLSFIAHLIIPFDPALTFNGILSVALTYAIMSVPFVFGGICTCLALTRFPAQVSKLYASDLAGAAAGCLMFIVLLNLVDGPTAVVVIGLLAALGALLFAREPEFTGSKRAIVATCFCLGVLAVIHWALAGIGKPLFQFSRVKVGAEPPAIYEKWNSYSRLRVFGNPFQLHRPWTWGISPTYPTEKIVSQVIMSIDAAAFTPIEFFRGKPEEVEHLRYDVTNVVHYLRPDSNVLVIGVGGGRDIVSSLIFKQRSVTGVEINQTILDIINRTFGWYTGRLDKEPSVTFVNDEAVSYVARIKEKFDIIQISLIDTSAATAAGAFALTENSLYTAEAWKIFLDHLSQRGILTVSRWYYRQRPGEMYRLTALAVEALERSGVKDPRRHIMIVGNVQPHPKELWPDGVGTILVSREPFSGRDISRLEEVARRMRFDVVLTPAAAADPTFVAIASANNRAFLESYPLNIAAPTDDNPYFFQLLRLRDILQQQFWEQGVMTFNLKAVVVLGALLVTVVVLTVLCILVPLAMTADGEALKGAGALLWFFAAIGLGFMFVEISQMQRLIIFLGHPVFSLSVVLFTLLISSSLGSLSTAAVGRPGPLGSPVARLVGLLLALVVFGALTPFAIDCCRSSATEVRILVAVAILFPLGFFMGMAFPMGMQVAQHKSPALGPWLWGINGATSVCASVAAVAIALTSGISSAFWAGAGCYLLAFAAYLAACRSPRPAP